MFKKGVKPHNYVKGGKSDHKKLYSVWLNMRNRCYRVKGSDYHNYGGRGITVCDEWLNSFVRFRMWALINGYKEWLQIDRVDNDGNYEPSNCRFVTGAVNAQNRSDGVLDEYKVAEIRKMYAAKTHKQTEIAELFKTSPQLINTVIKNKVWKV